MGEPHTVTPETKQTISVVIPALDEAPGIATVLSRFIPSSVSEVILADGGSKDDTPDIADAYGAIFVRSDRGRARQMNAGAKAATGDIVLFCHADTFLPDRFEDDIRKTLSVPGTSAGAFMLRFIEQNASPSLRFIAWTANLRSRYAQLPLRRPGYFPQKIDVRGRGRISGYTHHGGRSADPEAQGERTRPALPFVRGNFRPPLHEDGDLEAGLHQQTRRYRVLSRISGGTHRAAVRSGMKPQATSSRK